MHLLKLIPDSQDPLSIKPVTATDTIWQNLWVKLYKMILFKLVNVSLSNWTLSLWLAAPSGDSPWRSRAELVNVEEAQVLLDTNKMFALMYKRLLIRTLVSNKQLIILMTLESLLNSKKINIKNRNKNMNKKISNRRILMKEILLAKIWL